LHKSDERAQEVWREGFKKRDNLDDEYTILTIDQLRQVLSTPIYAWFPEGERRRQLDEELGNRLFDTLDDLHDAALSTLNCIEVPNFFTYLCP
jgi:hypothetical protein